MDGRVLGEVSAEVPGRKGVSGVAQPAALFALLATSTGGQCTLNEVHEYLRPGRKISRNALQQVLTQLRKSLGDEIVPRGSSSACSIRLPERSTDLLRFREGMRRARQLRLPERFDLMGDALAEWSDRGPLFGLRGERFSALRADLHEERLAAVDEQLEAAWSMEMREWLSKEAWQWLEREPNRESFFRFYLTSQVGEPKNKRINHLIDDWGRRNGRPGTELQRVIDAVQGRVSNLTRGNLRPVPDQLPGAVRRPLGRDESISALLDFVDQRRSAGRGALVVLSGMAGVGKTVTALHVADLLRERYPDGNLFAELHGFVGTDVDPVDPERILDEFLAVLPPCKSGAGTKGKAAALRSILAQRSMLVVLDDARDAEQVLPLLPGAGLSTVIITSRYKLTDLEFRADVHSCELGLLEDEAAAELLQEGFSVADRRLYAREFGRLARACDGNPLALKVIARRLKNLPPAAMGSIAKELEQEQSRLGELELPAQNLSVRAALACSVQPLSADARRLLWQLALHPGPSVRWETVRAFGLVGVNMRADRAVEELVAANLVELQSGRCRLHELVRVFARDPAENLVSEPSEEFEEATIRQILESQYQNTHACDRWLNDQRPIPLRVSDGITVVEPEGTEQAMAMLDEEYESLLGGIQLAVKQDLKVYMWLLPMALVTYQWRRRHLAAAKRGLVLACEAAEVVASPVDCAMAYRMLAGTLWRLDDFDLAAAHLQRAVHLSEQDATDAGALSLARSLHALALTRRKQENRTEAEQHHLRALSLYRQLSYSIGEAESLNGIGTLHYDRAEFDEALRVCMDAKVIAEAERDQSGLADVLLTLGKIRIARDERDEALNLYKRAIEIYRSTGNRPGEEKVLSLQADALVASGRSSEAVEALKRILVLRELMDIPNVQAVRERLEGLR